MKKSDAFYRIEIMTAVEEVPETSADIRLLFVVDGSFCIKKEESFYDLVTGSMP